MKIEFDKILLRIFFFLSGFFSIFIVIIEFFNISVFDDLLLIYITIGFFMQMTPFWYDRLIMKKDSEYIRKRLIVICFILLIYSFYLILIIFTVISLNNILTIFELFFLMISVGFIKIYISYKKKDNYMFCRIILGIDSIIILGIDSIIILLLSSIIFILNFFEHNSLFFFISLGLLLGGSTNLLYSIIWKFKTD